jgi:hypothetical protein
MEKIKTTFVQLNTNAWLIDTYELLAIDMLKKSFDFDLTDPENLVSKAIMLDENIGKNLTLVNLNAAIIEGTLRTLFSDILQRDSVTIGELSIANKNEKNYLQVARTYGMIKRLIYEVELSGGWENIKRQYREYADIDLDKLCSNEMKSALDTIFVIRNAAAHGTAFTMPKDKMVEDHKDLYPYKWQSKLHGMNMYVNTTFRMDFFNSLRSHEFSKHFMEVTQLFFSLVAKIDIFPEESKFHFRNVEGFQFGMDTSAHRIYRKGNNAPKE